jgi:hypothetical protein
MLNGIVGQRALEGHLAADAAAVRDRDFHILLGAFAWRRESNHYRGAQCQA